MRFTIGSTSTQAAAIIQNQGIDAVVPANDATLTLNGSGSYVFNGWLRDQDNAGTTRKLNVVKDGSGTQTFAALQTGISGSTTVEEGILRLYNTGYNVSPITINNGGTFQIDGTTNLNYNGGQLAIALNDGGTLENSNTGYTVLGAAVTNSGSTSIVQSSPATSTSGRGLFLDGGLKGTGTVTVNAVNAGSGVNFRNNNTNFAGQMIVNGIASTSAFVGSGISVGGASTGLQNADIQLNGTMELLNQGIGWANGITHFTMGALTGAGVVAGNYTSGGNINVAVGNTNSSGTFSGTIANGTGNIVNLVKIGTGTQTLSGTNTFTGATTINAGTLALQGGSALSDSSAVIFANAAGATLSLEANETIGSLAGGGTTGGTVSLGTNTLTVGGNSTNSVYAGAITGTGNLVKTGSGTQTFTGNTSYTGSTTVSQGNLTLSTNSLNSTSYILNDANTGSADTTLRFAGAFSATRAGSAGIGLRDIAPITVANQGTGITTIDINSSSASWINGTTTLNKAVTLKSTGGGIRAGFMTFTGPGAGAGNDTITYDAAGSPGGSNWNASENSSNVPVPSNFTGNVRFKNGLTDIQNKTYANASLTNLVVPDTASVTIDAGATAQFVWGAESMGALNGAGTMSLNAYGGNQTLTIGANNGSGTFSGTITNGGAVLSLKKVGTGTQTLSGANTYTGGTTVAAGALVLNNSTGSGTGSGVVSISPGATLTDDGNITGNVVVNANGTFGGTGTVGGPVFVNPFANLAAPMNGNPNIVAMKPWTVSLPHTDLRDGTKAATNIGSLTPVNLDGKAVVLAANWQQAVKDSIQGITIHSSTGASATDVNDPDLSYTTAVATGRNIPGTSNENPLSISPGMPNDQKVIAFEDLTDRDYNDSYFKVDAAQADLEVADLGNHHPAIANWPAPNEDAPGAFVAVNSDDDNGNTDKDGVADKDEGVPLLNAAPDSDWLAVTVDWNKTSSMVGDELTLSVTTGGDKVKVWYKKEDGTWADALKLWTIGPSPVEPPPTTVYVEGIKSSDVPRDVTLKLSHKSQTVEAVDEIKITVLHVDLDIDSDNTTAFAGPNRDAVEDLIENVLEFPGKYVAVNDDDDNVANLIPDFADGFNLNPADPKDNIAVIGEQFVPIVLHIPEPIDLSDAQVEISYSASNPADTEYPGKTPTSKEYIPAPGHLRLWTQKPEDGLRNMASISAGGHFVGNGTYSAATLGFNSSSTGGRTVTLYVEGIAPTKDDASRLISMNVHLDNSSSYGSSQSPELVLHDEVLVSVIQVDEDVDSDNDNLLYDPGRTWHEDRIEDAEGTLETPGKYVELNNDDDDEDTVPDFADGYDLDLSRGSDYQDDDDAKKDDEIASVCFDPYEQFTPVVIEIPKPLDLSKLRLKLEYDASDPTLVIRSGEGTDEDPYLYELPLEGSLRLWTRPTAQVEDVPANDNKRTWRSFQTKGEEENDDQLGFYVPPTKEDEWYTYEDLEKLGFSHIEDTESTYDGVRTVTLYLEGVVASEDLADQRILVKIDPDGEMGYSLPSETGTPNSGNYSNVDYIIEDATRVTVVGVDLQADSDNTSDEGPRDGEYMSDRREEQIEDHVTRPGKIVLVNDASKDLANGDTVPDFADGYVGSFGGSNSNEKFVPLKIQVPEWIDPEKALISFNYLGSDPQDVTRVGSAPNYGYVPAAGSLRLWNIDGPDGRDPKPIKQGNYISSDLPIKLEDLAVPDDDNIYTIYLEAVRPSDLLGDLEINVRLDPDGEDEENSTTEDFAVYDLIRVTALKASDAMAMSGDVRVADGVVNSSTADLFTNGFGSPWGHTRTWTSELGFAIKSLNGNGVEVNELPRLIQGTTSIIAIAGGTAEYFDRVGTGYQARFSTFSKLEKQGEDYILKDAAGGITTFHSFDPDTPYYQQGNFKSYEDAGGNTTSASIGTGGRISEVTRGATTFSYTYVQSGDNEGKIASVTFSNSHGTVRKSTYEYYDKVDGKVEDEHFKGNFGDLKTTRVFDGNNTLVDVSHYRYTKADKCEHVPGRLALALEHEQYQRAKLALGEEPTAVKTSDLVTYATVAFGYDEQGRANSQAVQGAGDSSATDLNARGQFGYTYAEGQSGRTGFNVWSTSTTVNRPGGTTETHYTNFAGELMLSAVQANGKEWSTYYKRDTQGRVVLQAMPSAVTDYLPAHLDLVDQSGSNYALLNDDEGVILHTDYFTSGVHKGYVREQSISQGEDGTHVKQATYTYDSDSSGMVHPIASKTVYRDEAGTDSITTQYDNSFSGRQVSERTTRLPMVYATQNGDGIQDTITETFNGFGWLANLVDADGFSHSFQYDTSTGAITNQTTDVGGKNISTSKDVDGLGRPVSIEDGMGNSTSIVYADGAIQSKVTITPALGPVNETRISSGTGITEHWVTPPDGGALVKASSEASDYAGRTVVATRHPESGTDYVTKYSFDNAGRLNQVINAAGTYNVTVFDGLGRVTGKKTGTNPSNQVEIASFEYDNGGVGDGNLTKQTAKPGVGTNRVTAFAYDWRNRQIRSQDAFGDSTVHAPIVSTDYDNLNQPTETRQYDGHGMNIVSNPNPSAGTLKAKSTANFDDRGRVFRSTVFSVDPDNGSVGDTLVTDRFYDGRSNIVKTEAPGDIVTETQFDGVGRAYFQSTGSAGTALEQTTTTYDNNDNVIFVKAEQREPGSAGFRTSYVGNWYDAANRLTDTVNFGTDAPAGGERPASAASASGLKTHYGFDSGGNVNQIVDPSGRVTRRFNDLFGRAVIVYQDYQPSGSDPHPNVGNESNLRTDYGYDGLDRQIKVSTYKQNTGSGTPAPNVTEYVYGVEGTINSNDLLGVIKHPGYTNATAISSSETFTYNALGERVFWRNRNNVSHTYTRDSLGRVTADTIGYPGNSGFINKDVVKLTYDFDSAGRASKFTSINAFGDVANQVERKYNGFGQVISEAQEHKNSVVSGSWTVGYGYEDSTGNFSRLDELTYANGRELEYGYDTGDVSRVTRIIENSSTLEEYGYLGIATVLNKERVASGQADLTTQLDTFGRTSEVTWANGSAVVDQYQYGYDVNSNLIWRNNAKAVADGAAQYGEQYGYDPVNRQVAFVRGTLTSTGDGGMAIAPANEVALYTSRWSLDSQGNRYTGKYGTAYTNLNRTGNGSDFTDHGTTQTVHFQAGNAGIKYDAWDRVAEISDGSASSSQKFSYDALGRRISTVVGVLGNGGYEIRHVYDGNNLIEDRAADGRVIAQYVWSAEAAPKLVLRDADADANASTSNVIIPTAGLEQRLYAAQDAQGSTTAILSDTGAVMERYHYDENGRPFAVKPDWSMYQTRVANTTTADDNSSHYNWQFLHKGGRFIELFKDYVHEQVVSGGQGGSVTVRIYQSGGGLYDLGGQWMDARLGRMLQPDPAAYSAGQNAYDSGIYLSNLDRARIFVGVAGLSLIAGAATGGLAYAAFGASTLGGAMIVGAAAGAGGGAVMSGLNARAEGDSWTDAGDKALQGAATGALGGMVGGAAGVAARGLVEAAKLTCAQGLGRVGGFLIGAAEGSAGGFAQGFAEGGIQTGTWEGAFSTGAINGAMGFGIGGGLGSLLHQVCFVAGTRVVVGVEEKSDEAAEHSTHRRHHGAASIADRAKLRFVTKPIEKIVADGGGEMGRGGSQSVVSRDQNDPNGKLTTRRILHTYERTAYTLQAVTLRDEDGKEQTLRVTEEHPFYLQNTGWTAAKSLQESDIVFGAEGTLQVVSNQLEAHPDGVTVYNLEVEQDHTYFVASESAKNTTAVWVHNANYTDAELDSLARKYAEVRSSPGFTWEGFAGQVGEDFTKIGSARSAIRGRARELGLVTPAPVDANGVADFSNFAARIVGHDGVDHGMSVFVQETLELQYGSHFAHLDAKFVRPNTHVWDHMPADGWFQTVRRDVHANTQHKGYELWKTKKG